MIARSGSSAPLRGSQRAPKGPHKKDPPYIQESTKYRTLFKKFSDTHQSYEGLMDVSPNLFRIQYILKIYGQAGREFFIVKKINFEIFNKNLSGL